MTARVRPSGNDLEDQEKEPSFSLLANMVVTLVQQPNRIGPPNMALQKRLSMQNQQVDTAEDEHLIFNSFTLQPPRS